MIVANGPVSWIRKICWDSAKAAPFAALYSLDSRAGWQPWPQLPIINCCVAPPDNVYMSQLIPPVACLGQLTPVKLKACSPALSPNVLPLEGSWPATDWQQIG